APCPTGATARCRSQATRSTSATCSTDSGQATSCGSRPSIANCLRSSADPRKSGLIALRNIDSVMSDQFHSSYQPLTPSPRPLLQRCLSSGYPHVDTPCGRGNDLVGITQIVRIEDRADLAHDQ